MKTSKKVKVFVGMDLHKSTTTFCAKDYEGNILDEKKVITNPSEISNFIHSLKGSSSLVMEPVSQWHFYADMIEGFGVDVHLAHPTKVKAIASAKIKTDTIDSRVLADLLRANLIPEAYRSPLHVRDWKELSRSRASLVHDRTQMKNRVHAILFKNALESPFGDLFGKKGRKWLEDINLPSFYRRSISSYLSLIDKYMEEIKILENHIDSLVDETCDIKNLMSIPGIGFVNALTIMAEIGDIERFPSARQLQSYAGLVPSTHSSGNITRHGRITKQGSKWLRYAMIEAAHVQTRCRKIQGFNWYYQRIRIRKNAQTAAVATARKLLAVVWRVLTDNRPFEERPPMVHHSVIV
jgi:transposase